VVILDADNVVAPDFLSRLNAVCQQGWQAIQCHRTAKNSDNDIAALDGLSEEINNTLFRRAHNNIGLSSALIGSGMCFSYEWFRRNVGQLSSAVEDRELEALLARQRIYVRYEEDLHVMDEKVSSQDNFQRQRLRWMTGQVQTLLLMLPYLPKAVVSLNLDYIDKTLQQMLIPRSILLVVLPCLSVLMTLLAPVWSIKWWCLTAAFCLALLIAIPSRLRSQALAGKIVMLIKLVWRMVKNLVHIDRKDQEFIHTTHDK
jgi:cellulose synthase/poly-beta-1,6-N-acetylglucosamine synthase-like glycosyltransferase